MQAFEAIQPGFCFAENHAGTNAAALSIRQGEAAWTTPRQNYCRHLTGCALYSVPSETLPSVILTIITTQKQLSGWPVALLRQLIFCMDLELRRMPPQAHGQEAPPARLTARQLTILRYVARGMTDRQLALELHISQETVRYHKKNLYRLLRAANAAQALARALRLDLISLGEIIE